MEGAALHVPHPRPRTRGRGAAASLLAAPLLAAAVAGIPASAADPALLVEGARLSVERRPRYDPAYLRLAFPGGDPGWERGVCSDLVVRAFRHAGIDLQALVHRDITARPGDYGLPRADPNIDHRRVRHLKTLFEHHARPGGDWRPGDIVIWDLKGGTTPNHIGIVSDRRGREGVPLVIHHMNRVGQFTGFPGEDDSLFRWRILGHFRWPAGRP